MQNAAKHSGATTIRVSLDGRGDRLGFVVEDDGVGFDPAAPTTGTGLANLRDRIESAGGTLTTGTSPGGGTRIRARLPVLVAAGAGPRRRADVTARLAWVLTVLTFVAVVADICVTAQYRNLLSEDAVAVHGFPFVDLAVLGAAVLGSLILTQDRRHPIGLLLLLIGFTGAVSLLTEAYSIWVVDENGPGSRGLAGWSGWLSTILGGQLSIAAIALIFLLAPDGRPLSRRWRYAVATTVLGALLCAAGVLIQNPTDYDISAATVHIGLLPGILVSVGFLLISAGLLASVVSMVLRLRRSRGEERQQVRLIALAAALVAVGLLNLFVVQGVNGGEQTWAASLPLYVAYVLLIALFGVAVLRYRLYDVEVILNRTLVLVLGTVFAAIGYTTLVIVVGAWVGPDSGGVWLSLLATALVAVAFQPLRRQVIKLANRLAYGSRAQPYEALFDFSHRIAEAPSAETLLPAVAERGRTGGVGAGCGRCAARPGRTGALLDVGSTRRGGRRARRTRPPRREELGSIRVWLGGGTPRALRRTTARGARRPDRRRLPQRRAAGPARRTRRRARPDHRGARPVPVPDHRGGRRGPAHHGGRHLQGRAAAPGRSPRRDHPRT